VIAAHAPVAKRYFFPLLLNCSGFDSIMGEFHSIGIDLLAHHWKQGKCNAREDLVKVVALLHMIFVETLLYIQPENLAKLKLILDRQTKEAAKDQSTSSSKGTSSSSTSSSSADDKRKKGKESMRSAAGRSLLRITQSRKDSSRRDKQPPGIKLFGGNLVEIMKYERQEEPTATVPRLITFLCEQLFNLDGMHA
jgi:hypothetical protein